MLIGQKHVVLFAIIEQTKKTKNKKNNKKQKKNKKTNKENKRTCFFGYGKILYIVYFKYVNHSMHVTNQYIFFYVFSIKLNHAALV